MDLVPTNYLRFFKADEPKWKSDPMMQDGYGDAFVVRQWYVSRGSLMDHGFLCSPDNDAIHGEWRDIDLHRKAQE